MRRTITKLIHCDSVLDGITWVLIGVFGFVVVSYRVIEETTAATEFVDSMQRLLPFSPFLLVAVFCIAFGIALIREKRKA
mgnify:CR=1 FL=1